MQAAQRRCLTVDRALVGEQLAGLAPVDTSGSRRRPSEPTAGSERERGDLPRERLRRRCDADVDHALAADPPADQLADHEPLTGPELELAQVDRSPAQPNAFALDLPHPPGAHEHSPPAHRGHEPVDPGRPPAEVDHDIHQSADVRAVGPDQRQPRETRHVHDPVRHATKPSALRHALRRLDRGT